MRCGEAAGLILHPGAIPTVAGVMAMFRELPITAHGRMGPLLTWNGLTTLETGLGCVTTLILLEIVRQTTT
jgi:hypothetical protein